jgi:hypothetical protein
MSDWKELLRTADKSRTLTRARSGLGLKTIYDLGEGGFDPTKPLTKLCDCSGFIAWAIGIPREFPPRTDRWMDTDAYWGGGGAAAKAAGFPLLTRVEVSEAVAGDLMVYPDSPGGGEGHMGIISSTDADGLKVIHCSRGNWRGPKHDAVQETDARVFTSNSRTRVMRIDYDAMRRYAGVAGHDDEVGQPHEGGDTGEVVTPNALHHPLLAAQPTLQLVVTGQLKLRRTGSAVSGIGSVQQAMNILAREHGRYAIDLGPNEANSGIFGRHTEDALKALQADSGLPETGALDAPTLLALDALLVRHSELDVDGGGQPADVEAAPAGAAAAQALIFELSHEGSRWFATTGGERFYVGTRVRYGQRWGLMNASDNSGAVYDPAANADQYGHWAYFIAPTASGESEGRFKCINTYDSAGFTYGFLQFAAHVADGDFVKFFRALLGLDERTLYFPELELSGGRIVRRTSSGLLPLETAASSEALMHYLNPSSGEVEDREVLSSAKFIHWGEHSAAQRAVQVRVGIQTAKEKVQAASRHMRLDGRSDKVCLVVMDILHQGRGTYDVMANIVNNNNDAEAYTKLLTVGGANYAPRIATIRRRVAEMEAAGLLGRKRYVAASNDFV